MVRCLPFVAGGHELWALQKNRGTGVIVYRIRRSHGTFKLLKIDHISSTIIPPQQLAHITQHPCSLRNLEGWNVLAAFAKSER